MSLPTEEKKTPAWIPALWIAGVVLALYFGLRFTSPRTESGGGSQVITSAAQYNEIVNRLEKAQMPVMNKFYQGEPLTTDDIAILETCLKDWQALIAFAPTKPSNHFGAGEVCFVIGDYPNSIRHLQGTINGTGPDATGDFFEMRLRAFGIVSQASFLIGRYDQAVSTAKEAIKMAPNDPQFALLEAQAVAQVDEKFGVQLLEGYVKKYPDYEPLRRRLEFFKKPKPPTKPKP